MRNFCHRFGCVLQFVVENESYEGIKRVSRTIAKDFESVTGVLPDIRAGIPETGCAVLFAVLGKSPYIERLINAGVYDPAPITGKREVYQITFIEKPFGGADILLVCGSDKRGAIYGMFALSEYIGVSPLVFWGNAVPARKENIQITPDIETVSKEPSVRYRGFFINDEWPCFGNWAQNRYGGFNARMYEYVFELLLRLKGNYLWPAMWTASFALDGPGAQNEELADIYGVIIGGSHHEPCLRASEEWDKVKGENSVYGSVWDFRANRDGLTRYWADGLKRSGKYEKIITIGMRGERDSAVLGAEGIRENAELLKDIITCQRGLINKYAAPGGKEPPLLLALYKEVEEYYYGTADKQGFMDWDGLDDVILLLCDDNFGNTRALPSAQRRERAGGYGMYYHFDYHGGPVSYEWLPSTPFEKIWEQMSQAYDYGVRELWIVNIGDLKFNEIPLCYFMDLAYDFGKWGTVAPNTAGVYIEQWLGRTFPAVNTETHGQMARVLFGYIGLNALRRPEALNAEVYHPCCFNEADRILERANAVYTENEAVFAKLTGDEKDAYYSMIYYPAAASINHIKMYLYAAKNMHYAKQGRKTANVYCDFVTQCIANDKTLAADFARFKNGKWVGMELAPHIGFVKWNEDNCRYPLRVIVEPAYKPRLSVSRADSAYIYSKQYGAPPVIRIDDFIYAGVTDVCLEIANDGIGRVDYVIEKQQDYPWLSVSKTAGSIEDMERVFIYCSRELLTAEPQTARLLIKDAETIIIAEVTARHIDTSNLPPMTFLQKNGVIAIEARHYCEKKDAAKGAFKLLKPYGRSGSGMKVYPTTAVFTETDEKPEVTYRFNIEETGEYITEFYTAPSNPVQRNTPLTFTARFKNTGSTEVYERLMTVLPAGYEAGSYKDKLWTAGVMNNIRITMAETKFEKGVCEVTVSAPDPGFVLERIVIYNKDNMPPVSYLGPAETYFTSGGCCGFVFS